MRQPLYTIYKIVTFKTEDFIFIFIAYVHMGQPYFEV
jgi:hypothetical protein